MEERRLSWYRFLKRCIDIAVSAVGLVILSPLFAVIAIAINLVSPGPVFYKGRRVGLNGRVFRVVKFRSMVVDAEYRGGSATAEDDPRLTSLGVSLRRYKIDELPQLINVWLGDMSLVGPRPEVEKYVAQYTAEERHILDVRPGITDWASLWNFDEGAVLAGHPDPEEAYELIIRPTKLKLQMWYVRDCSLGTDAVILGHTFMKLVFRGRWQPKPLRSYVSPFELALALRRSGRNPESCVSAGMPEGDGFKSQPGDCARMSAVQPKRPTG